jgi:hypothetical protein
LLSSAATQVARRSHGAFRPASSGDPLFSDEGVDAHRGHTKPVVDNDENLVHPLEAAKAFSPNSVMELEGEAPVEGRWVDLRR